MTRTQHHSAAFILLPILALVTSSVSAQSDKVFKAANALWHMREGSVVGDAALNLTVQGGALLGIKLEGVELTTSLARGGDGYAAKLDGGHLVIGAAGKDAMGARFDGWSYTLHLRVKPAACRRDA
jgi:hypothetical protein